MFEKNKNDPPEVHSETTTKSRIPVQIPSHFGNEAERSCFRGIYVCGSPE